MTSGSPLPVYCNVPDDAELFGSFRGIVQYERLHQQAADLSPEPVPDTEMVTGGNTSLALVLYTSGSTGVPKGNSLFSGVGNSQNTSGLSTNQPQYRVNMDMCMSLHNKV
jgi:acyl-coenzyme A synthetase/AMP-(fatty) acid ligase